MPATDQNAQVIRGASYEIRIPCTDEAGDSLPLTGLDLFYRIARQVSAEPVFELDTADITIDGAEAIISLTTERTLELTHGLRYYHELYTIESGERHILMSGRLTVVASQAALHVEA